MIKTQQMPQEEVERFAKDNKALKTTVYVVGALALCFSPMGFTFVFLRFEDGSSFFSTLGPHVSHIKFPS